MHPDLKLVIRLQEIDNRSTELTREIAALPKHIAEIEKKLISHEHKLDADKAALTANQKERKSSELGIQSQEEKISKLKDQMQQAKNNEQYRAFQHEIEFCQKEIRRLEDRILELMSEAEPLDRNVKSAQTALEAERAQVAAESKTARERTQVDKDALSVLLKERAGIGATLTPSTFQRYERVRKARAGIGIAEAVDGRCSVCNMSMRLQFFQDLKRGGQIMSCESCQRILYYNPPVAVEDLGAC
jgi:uncharacterized protein